MMFCLCWGGQKCPPSYFGDWKAAKLANPMNFPKPRDIYS